MRSLLEANGLVVDEVDGRADYGRDLNVDLTNASRVTAGIIGVQVKGGRSFYRKGRWVIPASPTDWEYWRSSTLPVIGMTWDPDTQIIHWVNLTQHARARVLISDTSYGFELQNDQAAHVVAEQVLTQSTFGDFLNEVNKYLRATSSSAFLDLLSGDDETRRRGVYACWTLGRRDPRPLMLLRNLLPRIVTFGALWRRSVIALWRTNPVADAGSERVVSLLHPIRPPSGYETSHSSSRPAL